MCLGKFFQFIQAPRHPQGGVEHLQDRVHASARQFRGTVGKALQDLILAAVNGALKAADDKTSQSMAKLQSGMGGFPGLF